MTSAEVKRCLMKVLSENAERPFDEVCSNIADVALELQKQGKITSIVVTGKGDSVYKGGSMIDPCYIGDRCTNVDVGLPNGDLLEVEIQ